MNKTAVITGATSGIGLATAQALAQQGWYIIGIGRSEERCVQAKATIEKAGASGCEFTVADLSSQNQIKRAAKEIMLMSQNGGRGTLDVLINNAGTFSNWFIQTEDGIELQFAVNYLAHFHLTLALLPALSKASEPRIISVSSASHRHTHLRWNDIQLRKHYSGLRAYKQTKLANVLFSAEFNRRYSARTGIQAFVADPGLVRTEIGLKSSGGLAKLVWKVRMAQGRPPIEGAETSVFLATEPTVYNSGQLYWRNNMPVAPDASALNQAAAERLWQISERMCGIEQEKEPD
ncbi:SDR family oxidoreductase [Sediminispirochaeta bajacaliforniensis]|uniref:SDR family oxidoreductase n=1 Tax=Sediminispirochaeta bajacaliforniensis TaxID=148 RepID=UPI00036979C4|nr:SDR family oxidoreductase [Sediminispirochaeta bajacaliforniensis]